MGDREPELSDSAAGPSDNPFSNSPGILGTIRAVLPSLSWLQSPRKPTIEEHHEEVTKGDDEAAMDVDTDDESQNVPQVVKDASFVTVSTQSSQEYDKIWAGFSAEDLEEVAANAERMLVAKTVDPGIPREGSGSSTTSSLGKRPRSGSTDAVSVPKRRTYREADDNPFITAKSVPDERASAPSSITIAQFPRHIQDDIEGLAWGVQWEIARLVSADFVTYTDVVAHLPHLKGSNEQAASKVIPLLRPLIAADTTEELGPESVYVAAGTAERARKSPWPELDCEETALQENPYSGLGFSKKYPGWYGGQVQFIAKLKENEKDRKKGHISSSDASYKVVLQKPELGPSNRFARRFGSRRFIRVRVSKAILKSGNKALTDYFQRPFLLSGRVFRAFSAKDGNVFLVETPNSTPQISRRSSDSLNMQPDFMEFLKFHNPIMLNRNQALAKWAARFALGLSNSVPGLILPVDNIHYIEDIVAPFEGRKPPPEKIFTDGCGWINVTALRMLQANLGWERLPTAVQFRLDGAKGVLLLHPDGKYVTDDQPHVWIRPSQTKIHYDNSTPADSARLIIDVLRPARLKYPARLSAETIVNIAHNQTHASANDRHRGLRQLMREGLHATVCGLVKGYEETPRALPNETNLAMPLLWHEVSRAGGVMGVRMAREFSGSARARGFGSRWDEEEEEDEEEGVTSDPLDRDMRPNGDLSGYPLTLEETAMALLGAGFEPNKSKFLNDKLKFIVRKGVAKYTQRYKIEVPGSAEAFCVPDPKGVLEPGEIYLRTSQPIKGPNGVEVDVLIGDVLVTRHPTKLPTDVQKVRAVHRAELDQYTDVIVFSTKGERSLASLLAGGDCDGDTVTAIWEPRLVESFVNADVAHANPPDGLDSSFERDANESVQEFLDRVSAGDTEFVINELQTVLLASLRDVSTVGSYSIWHDNAVYSKGYDHPETTRLAFMFCSCLDGAKTGLRVKAGVFKADKQRWDRRGPSWKESEEPSCNQKALTRGHSLATFIMDDLKNQGKKLSDEVSKRWDTLAPPEKPDEDLLRPWMDALSRATRAKELNIPQFLLELDAIAAYVQRVRDQYSETWRLQMSPSKARLLTSPSRSRHPRPTNPSHARVNDEIAHEFAKGPPKLLFINNSHREELKASYAYYLDTRKSPFGSFAFNIAFRELLRIKSEAKGGVPVGPNFYRCFDIQSGVKALSRRPVQ